MHAVSVGEVASAIPLIKRLRSDQPLVPIYLSTSTLAGRKAAERQAAHLVDGIFFAPLDYPSCVRRVLKIIQPALVVVLETEIWPNLYAQTKRFGARLAVVNGRISDRAWPRYRFLATFFSPILQLPNTVLVQSPLDYDRYAELGVAPGKLYLAGNLKYDASLASASQQIPTFGAEQIWIAASTVGPNERGSLVRHSMDEDDLVIDAFVALANDFPHLLLVLAPRQPLRFDTVARQTYRATASALSAAPPFPKSSRQNLELPGVLLLDTIGELTSFFPLSDAVFVGGSIAPRGGHNIIEPALAGAAIVIGPHMQNFAAIARDFREAEALVQIQHESELLPAIRDLLRNGDRARILGERARRLVLDERGAADRITPQLWPLYHPTSLDAHNHGFLSRLLLTPAAWLWREGGKIRRRIGERYAASMPRLPAPVVSIGGITAGGSGKTPFTNYLAARLAERGHRPAILSRGYRRRSPARYLILPPAAKVPAAFSGDEAQIFLRAGIAPVGIGANRFEAATILLHRFPQTDVLLLDDGFQHARIARDFDVVLIDGLDPFGQEELIPLGRLREPLDALGRADAFVITRAEVGFRYDAICARLREYNAAAPVFRTQLHARQWRHYGQEHSSPRLNARRVAAFCGLGNAQNFWNTLESLGLEIVFRWSFSDHHRYSPVEVRRVAHQARLRGAEMLVTTEKDRINCPARSDALIAPLTLAWLEIELELEDESSFLSFLEENLRRRAVHANNSAR